MYANHTESTRETETTTKIRDVAELHDSLRKYCLSLTESAWEAEDLAQDAWLKALAGPRFDTHPNPEAYLLRIAKNAWIDRARRSAKLSRILKTVRPPEGGAASIGALEIEAAFRALAEHLPPLQRAAFLLRDVLGYSSAETAERLRVTEGAAKAALHRARRNLPRVREDLENGEDRRAADQPGLAAYARAIATAYEVGDVEAMLASLAAIDSDSESAPAIGLLHSGRLRSAASRRAEAPRGGAPSLSLASLVSLAA
ncbi:RNA polymerase sigma factor [Cohnella hongkongensis]|uniref:RNA polymerase sigma factor n=1 Tax=Cohnella hongkongensis TaxID=178337 RepID=A0ABV9F6P7_9BACL